MATDKKKSARTSSGKNKVRKQPPVDKHGRGKRYLESAKLIDRAKAYDLDEALDLLVKSSTVKFDASAEAHIQTGLNPKQADQNIRGTVSMPAGTGKSAKVLVFAEGPEAEAAKKAGADYVGGDELIDKIAKGWMDFDVAIATPEIMSRVGKLGKTLGTKGMMPNPKSETVTKDPAKAVTEFKQGKVEFKLDKDAIIHIGFGKISLGKDKLKENFLALFRSVTAAKPASAKGMFIKKISLSSSMGPGIKLDPNSI